MPDSRSRSVYRRREGEGYSRQNNALTRILGGPPHVVPTGDALDGGGNRIKLEHPRWARHESEGDDGSDTGIHCDG